MLPDGLSEDAVEAEEAPKAKKARTATDILRGLAASAEGRAAFDAAPELGTKSLEALCRGVWAMHVDHATTVGRLTFVAEALQQRPRTQL